MDIAKLMVRVGADTKDAEQGLERVNKGMGGIGVAGVAAAAGVAAVGAGLAASVAAATGFEQTMSAVGAVSGASAAEMQQLSDLALKLGKDTVFSASEAGKGIEELVKGGVSLADVSDGAAQAMLDLAAAGGVSLPEAAEIAANSLAMFGLEGKDMAHAADLIAGAANASSLEVSDFRLSMAASGAIAAQSGQSIEDLAQSIAIMGQAGIKGSDAGTSLKTMLMRLQPTTKAAIGAMTELGIITEDGANQFIDANGQFKSMAEIAGVLQDATEGLTDAEKMMAFETIFGSDAIRAAAVMAKEGETGFNDMAAAMGKVTAAEVAAQKMDNFAGSMEQLKGSLETAGIKLGMLLLPLLRKAVDWFSGLIDKGIELADVWGPKIGGAFDTVKTAVQPLVDVIKGLFGAFTGGGVEGAQTALSKLFGPEVAGMVMQVVDIFREWVGHIHRVAGAFVKLVQTGDLKGFISSIFGSVDTLISNVGPKLAGLAESFIAWVGPMIPPLLTKLGEFASEMLTWIVSQVPVLIGKLSDWTHEFIEWIAPAIRELLPKLGELLKNVLDWLIANGPKLLKTFISEWVPAAIGWVARAAIDIIPKLLELVLAIGGWILGTGVPKLIEFAWKMGEAIVTGIIEGLGNLGKMLWDTITKALSELVIDFGWIKISGAKGVEFNIPLPELKNPFDSGQAAVPAFATGGIVPGPIGAPMLALVHGGETITPPGQEGPLVNINATVNNREDIEVLAYRVMQMIDQRQGQKRR